MIKVDFVNSINYSYLNSVIYYNIIHYYNIIVLHQYRQQSIESHHKLISNLNKNDSKWKQQGKGETDGLAVDDPTSL